MAKIVVQFNPKFITLFTDEETGESKYILRISEKDHNGLSISDTGEFIATPKTSEDAGFVTYYAGNGIQCDPEQPYSGIEYARCNSSVSRIVSTDPLGTNVGVNVSKLIDDILGR